MNSYHLITNHNKSIIIKPKDIMINHQMIHKVNIRTCKFNKNNNLTNKIKAKILLIVQQNSKSNNNESNNS